MTVLNPPADCLKYLQQPSNIEQTEVSINPAAAKPTITVQPYKPPVKDTSTAKPSVAQPPAKQVKTQPQPPPPQPGPTSSPAKVVPPIAEGSSSFKVHRVGVRDPKDTKAMRVNWFKKT